MPATETDLLAAIRAVLDDRHGLELALLFGSRGRGAGSSGSDADLAILGRGVDRLALARDLSLATGVEFDVLDLARASYALLKSVLHDGIVLHEGKLGAAARWRASATARLEDERPGFERMRDSLLTRLAAGDG